MKRIFATLFVAAMFLMGGCEQDDNNTTDKYLATSQLKEITLENTSIINTSVGSSSMGVTILQDYNYRYNLRIYKGSIAIVPFYRQGGAYSNEAYAEDKELWAGIEDKGVYASVEELSGMPVPGGSGFYVFGDRKCQYAASFQPNHGYSATMGLESQSQTVVIYAKDYTLDSEGTLLTATLEYKLR